MWNTFNNGTQTPFEGVAAVDLSPDQFYTNSMAVGDADRDGGGGGGGLGLLEWLAGLSLLLLERWRN